MIVARYEADELEDRRERQAQRGGTSAAQAEARRRRVSRSQGAVTDEHAEDTADDAASGEEE